MDSMNAGVKRLPIAALGENMPNIMLVGIIIAKQNSHIFTSKQTSTSGTERAVWNFTLRDSPYDFINGTFWGSKEFVNSIAEKFSVGDIVEISRPKISFRQAKEQKDKFAPSVTSPFQLSLQENQSVMVFHEAEDCHEFLTLLHLPTKPPGDYFTLSDVYHSGNTMRGDFGNLLVAVRDVGTTRQIQTKDGREMKCRDIMVFDQTNTGLPFTIWNSETIVRADNWRARETVLFLADVRLDWNAFRRGMAASDGPRTIVTEDPDTTEAAALRSYARTAPIKATALLTHLANSIQDPNSISSVMTVQRVKDRAYTGSLDNSGGDDSQFTALIYAILTQYDLDGYNRLTVNKCSKCQTIVQDVCQNLECPIGSGAEFPSYELSFDVRVRLSDHTGSLENVRLCGSAAEKVIGCSVNEFVHLSDNVKTQLKWKLMLERCAARVLVLRASSDRPVPLVSLLSCSVADPAEVSACLPLMY